MGCCGGGYNQSENNDNNSCHGGRGFNICHIILIGGIILLVLKAAL